MPANGLLVRASAMLVLPSFFIATGAVIENEFFAREMVKPGSSEM